MLDTEFADNSKQSIMRKEISLQPYLNLQTAESDSHFQEEDMQRFSDLQLKQQQEVFVFSFIEPFADYLESLSSTDVLVVTHSGQHFYESNQSIINTQSESVYDSHISEEQIKYCWINGDNGIENQKQLSDFYDHPAVFRHLGEISLSEIYQQFHKFIIAPDCIKVSDIPADYSVINPTENINGHFGSQNQMVLCCDIHDSVTMKSAFSKNFRFDEVFQINTKCKCRYKLPVECLLQKNSVFCIVLSAGKKEDYVISQMLLWLHWKYHVT